MSSRNIVVTNVMKEDAIKMLQLLGVPVILAPCEAEAQCGALAKQNKVFATVTEDMDALPFGTPVMIRNVNNKKEPVVEINAEEMLKEMGFSFEQFIDLCILCGCDFSDKIEGIGPIKAFNLISEHKKLENVFEALKKENESSARKKKFIVPENFAFEEVRELFLKPVITDPSEITVLNLAMTYLAAEVGNPGLRGREALSLRGEGLLGGEGRKRA